MRGGIGAALSGLACRGERNDNADGALASECLFSAGIAGGIVSANMVTLASGIKKKRRGVGKHQACLSYRLFRMA